MDMDNFRYAVREGKILLSYDQHGIGRAELWQLNEDQEAGEFAGAYAVNGPLTTGFRVYKRREQEQAVADYHKQIVHLRQQNLIGS